VHGAQRRPAARREADELGPAVARVGDPLDVAVTLQGGHHLRHRLTRDAQVDSEAGGVPTASQKRNQQQSVHRPQAGHALRGELRPQPLRARSGKHLDKCRDGSPVVLAHKSHSAIIDFDKILV